jgi:hypothetical protein
MTGSLLLSSPVGSIRQLAPDSALYKAAAPHVTKWRAAIVARDVLTFVSFAFPEDREWMVGTLSNPKSTQFQYVFSSWEQSLRSRLSSRTRLVLFEEVELRFGDVEHITACFVSGSEARRTWPQESQALKDAAEKAEIPCQLFMKVRDGWFAELGSTNGWY